MTTFKPGMACWLFLKKFHRYYKLEMCSAQIIASVEMEQVGVLCLWQQCGVGTPGLVWPAAHDATRP